MGTRPAGCQQRGLPAAQLRDPVLLRSRHTRSEDTRALLGNNSSPRAGKVPRAVTQPGAGDTVRLAQGPSRCATGLTCCLLEGESLNRSVPQFTLFAGNFCKHLDDLPTPRVLRTSHGAGQGLAANAAHSKRIPARLCCPEDPLGAGARITRQDRDIPSLLLEIGLGRSRKAPNTCLPLGSAHALSSHPRKLVPHLVLVKHGFHNTATSIYPGCNNGLGCCSLRPPRMMITTARRSPVAELLSPETGSLEKNGNVHIGECTLEKNFSAKQQSLNLSSGEMEITSTDNSS